MFFRNWIKRIDESDNTFHTEWVEHAGVGRGYLEPSALYRRSQWLASKGLDDRLTSILGWWSWWTQVSLKHKILKHVSSTMLSVLNELPSKLGMKVYIYSMVFWIFYVNHWELLTSKQSILMCLFIDNAACCPSALMELYSWINVIFTSYDIM